MGKLPQLFSWGPAKCPFNVIKVIWGLVRRSCQLQAFSSKKKKKTQLK